MQNTEEEPIASGTTAAATAAHTRYLSSPAAATLHGKTQGFVLRLPPQNKAHATFMHPLQCDLQAQLQETHRTMHTGTTTRCRTQRRNQSRPERPQPQPPHTRGTFHRRLQPLYTEKFKVSCSSYLPKTKPMQHSCSHSNAICNHSIKKRIELRTQEQHGTTTRCRTQRRNQSRNDRGRNRRTHEVPFIAGCSHFTRKNARFRVPASSPKQSPCNMHASSPLPSVITSQSHHFPSSPLPFVTSPLPFVTTSHRHHFPSSPLPIVTTSLPHHFPSSPPSVIASYFFVMYCSVMYCYVVYHPSSRSTA